MPRNVIRILSRPRARPQKPTQTARHYDVSFSLAHQQRQQRQRNSSTAANQRSTQYHPDDGAPSSASLSRDRTAAIQTQELSLLHESREKLRAFHTQLIKTTHAAQQIPSKTTSIVPKPTPRPSSRRRGGGKPKPAIPLPPYTIGSFKATQEALPAAITATTKAIEHLDIHLCDLILEDFPSYTAPPPPNSPHLFPPRSSLASLVEENESDKAQKRVWQARLDAQIANLSEEEKRTLLQDWRYEEEARLRRLEHSGHLFATHVKEIQALGAGEKVEWGGALSSQLGGVVGRGTTSFAPAMVAGGGRNADAIAAMEEEQWRRQHEVGEGVRRAEEVSDWEALEDGIGNPDTNDHHGGEESFDNGSPSLTSRRVLSSSLRPERRVRSAPLARSSERRRLRSGGSNTTSSSPSSSSSPPQSRPTHSGDSQQKSQPQESIFQVQKRLAAAIRGTGRSEWQK